MLKRIIAHPLKLGLFFLCIAGTLPAQNDSKPVQNDSRALSQDDSGMWSGPANGCPVSGNFCPPPPGNFCPPSNCCPIPNDYWNSNDYSCCPPYFNDPDCCNNCCYDNNCGQFLIGFEGLYWRVNEDNLGFAEKHHSKEKIVYTTPNSSFPDGNAKAAEATLAGDNDEAKYVAPPAGATVYGSGRVRKDDFDFRWRPGFRLSAAYLFPCNCWDLDFRWTHFLNSSSRDSKASGALLPPYASETSEYDEEQVKSTFLPSTYAENQYVNHVDAHWHINFNNYEIAFGRHICVGCGFGIRPYIGVKILDIEQRLHLDTKRNHNYLDETQNYGSYEQKIKTEFTGVGFQGGFCADWCLGCGFSLLSNVSGGIVYGRAHVRERFNSDMTRPGAAEATYENWNIKFKHSTHVSRPNLDLGIGLRWETCLCNCYYLGLKLGWEYHHYFDQNFFRLLHNDAPGRGDLAMHGVTFGADVGF